MKRISLLAAASAFFVLAGGGVAHAETRSPHGCEPSDLASGACATFVAVDGEDPLAAAVRTLVSDGDRSGAEQLVDVSAAHWDVKAALFVLADPSVPVVGSVSSFDSRSDVRSRAARSAHVSDWMWELEEPITYGYCGPSGCQVIGRADMNLWHDLLWYDDLGPGVAGSFFVNSGPAVQFSTLSCKTFYEVFPFDQVLRDWSNCRSAGYPGFTKSRQIDWSDFRQGSAVGTQYHLELTVQFAVQGGGDFKGVWNSNSYRITGPLSAKFLH